MEFIAGKEERFFNFIAGLSEKDRIAVISHTDGDGVCSAILASKVIGKVDFVSFYDYIPGTFMPLLEEMKKKKINKVLFLDLNLFESEAKEIERFAEILLIDHHPLEKDVNSSRTAFLKADCGAACYVCYYLFSKIQKIPEWIAAIGTLSDTTHKYQEKNIDDFFKDFGFSKLDNLWEKTFDLSFLIIYFKDNLEKVYDLLMKAKNFDELGIEKYTSIVRKEFNKQFEKYEKQKEVHRDLIFYQFSSKYDVKTLIINKLSVKNPGKTFVFLQILNKENSYEISARRQDGKISCPELLKKSVMGIPNSNAGGHFKAAGGRIPKENLEKFKENLLRVYEEMSKS